MAAVFVIFGNKKIGTNTNALFFIPLIILALCINAFGSSKVSKLFSGQSNVVALFFLDDLLTFPSDRLSKALGFPVSKNLVVFLHTPNKLNSSNSNF